VRANGKPLSTADAAEKYGISKSSARNYVEFDVNPNKVDIIENPITKATEYTVKGDVDLEYSNAKFFKRCK
jgi:response regulator of citrate/malate metabolism